MKRITLNDRGYESLLNLRRLPARLNSEEAAAFVGVQGHDIPILIRKKLLRPLGGGAKNTVKYFSTLELERMSQDRKWLDDVTKALRRSRSEKGEAESVSPD